MQNSNIGSFQITQKEEKEMKEKEQNNAHSSKNESEK